MVRNAAAVRGELEHSGKVLAVFQGHSHANDYQQIAGIHYCTLVAMVEGSGLESSGYSMLEIMPDDSLRLRGFRRQLSREFRRQNAESRGV
jgi:alkaline phosphatase